MHPSRRPQLVFGVRGVVGLELTVYGPARPLHSGHYGNWAPNPIARMSELLASLRDGDGRIRSTLRSAVWRTGTIPTSPEREPLSVGQPGAALLCVV